MKKVKIIFCIPRMNNGGAERVVANLANELSLTYEVKILTFVGTESYYQLNQDVKFQSANIDLNRKNRITRKVSMLHQVLRAFSFLDNEFKTFKPDVVVSFLMEADLLTFILHKKYKYFWISSERNDPGVYTKIRQLVLRYIYKSVDLFVCQSSYVYIYYANIPSERKIVIPNPIGNSILGELKKEKSPIKVVSIGRLVQQKNFALLIRAFNRIRSELAIEMSLTIYGDGPQKECLKKLIKSLKMETIVQLPGSDKNVLENIADAALYVMSSDYEGFPNALLEAAAMGIPVIATDVKTGTVKDLVTDQIGMIVPVNDEMKLAKAMKRMITDSEFRQSIRGKQMSVIRNKYSQESIAKQWVEAIEKAYGII